MKTTSTEFAAFSIRISLFALMILWAILKITNPGAYGGSGDEPGIFESFYGVSAGGTIVLILGILQIVLLLAFVLGLFKTITYCAVLLMNLSSFVVALPRILDPYGDYPNMLFLASIPILGASIALFLIRNQDRFLSLQR